MFKKVCKYIFSLIIKRYNKIIHDVLNTYTKKHTPLEPILN